MDFPWKTSNKLYFLNVVKYTALQETWASGAAEGVGGFPVGCRFGYFFAGDLEL